MDNQLKIILEKLGVGESLIIKIGDGSQVEFRANNVGNIETRVEPLGLATVFARNELDSWLRLLSGFAGGQSKSSQSRVT